MRTCGIVFRNASETAFSRELRGAVAQHFRDRGTAPFADRAMVVKTLILLTLTFGTYALLVSVRLPPLAMLGLTVVLGTGLASIGFCVVHDALHDSYSSSRRWNSLLGTSLELLGGSRYFWRLSHNLVHHTYTNVSRVDEDLTAIEPLMRLDPAAPRRRWHRWQHLYAWPLYSLVYLNWVFVKDYRALASSRVGPFENIRHPRGEIARMFAFKGIHLSWALVVPMLILPVPFWHVLIGYLCMALVGGLILSVVFQLAHVTEGLAFARPDRGGVVPSDWLVHQIRTTSNFAPRSRLWTWYLGGLNHQIEHHAFPRICGTHYRDLAPIVEDACRRHSVPYHVRPSLWAAIASHYRVLKYLGSHDEVRAHDDDVYLVPTVGEPANAV
jgi:linoleoyl-CoA desaturase